MKLKLKLNILAPSRPCPHYLYVSLTAIRFILYQGADASPVPYSLNHHHLFIVTYPSTYSHMHYLTSISASGHRVPVRIAHRMELQLNYTHYLPL